MRTPGPGGGEGARGDAVGSDAVGGNAVGGDDRAAALQRAAREKVAAGEVGEAIERQREAVALLAEACAPADPAGLGRHCDAIETLAHYYRAAGDLASARAALREALTALEARPDPARRARTLDLLGLFAAQSAALDEARAAWAEAVEVHRERLGAGGGDAALARAVLRLGQWHVAQQGWSEAIRHLTEAIAQFERAAAAGPVPELIDALNLLATSYSFTARAGEAVPVLERALALARAHRDRDTSRGFRAYAAQLMNSLGRFYLDAGRPAEARAVLEECLGECRSLVADGNAAGLRTLLSAVLYRLGQGNAALGAVATAQEQLAESIGLMQVLVESEGRSDLAEDLAMVQAELRRLQTAGRAGPNP